MFAMGINQLLNDFSDTVKNEIFNIKSQFNSIEEIINITKRIISPNIRALEFTNKPLMDGNNITNLKNYFHIPDFLLFNNNISQNKDDNNNDNNISLFEIKYYIENVANYPILLKGKKQGAIVCKNWNDVMNAIGNYSWIDGNSFVQKIIYGYEICYAFCAYKGELIECIMMKKSSITFEGKVWIGEISLLTNKNNVNMNENEVDANIHNELYLAIKEFVKLSNWTGGGEIETIKDLTGTIIIQTIMTFISFDFVLGKSWLIDFNPRFPAWIFASSYTLSCNLPALLMKYVFNDLFPNFVGHQNNFIENGINRFNINNSISFIRSIIEEPLINECCNNFKSYKFKFSFSFK